jgi:hypothetical protein
MKPNMKTDIKTVITQLTNIFTDCHPLSSIRLIANGRMGFQRCECILECHSAENESSIGMRLQEMSGESYDCFVHSVMVDYIDCTHGENRLCTFEFQLRLEVCPLYNREFVLDTREFTQELFRGEVKLRYKETKKKRLFELLQLSSSGASNCISECWELVSVGDLSRVSE